MEEKNQADKAAVEKRIIAAREAAGEPAEATEAAEPPAVIVVPAPPDAGNDGFPKLPEVSQMLGEASSTLKNVNSEANYLESRVVQAQEQSALKMAKQKAAFEEKLKAQEEGNRAVIMQNAQITDAIAELKKENDDLRAHAKQLQETNRLSRSELHTLETKLGAARDFVAHSLSSTDDSRASELTVLQVGGTEKKDDNDGDSDSDDSDSDDESDGEADSFLALSSTAHRAGRFAEIRDSFEAALAEMEAVSPSLSQQQRVRQNPGDLLEQLSKEVAALASQEKASAKKLKELFIRDFRAGAKRHQALIVQQKALNSTRNSLTHTRTELQKADAHLENTRSQLQERLQGLGHFMQKLAHLALAPTKEVKHLVSTLPKAPVIAQPKKISPQV